MMARIYIGNTDTNIHRQKRVDLREIYRLEIEYRIVTATTSLNMHTALIQ